MPTTILSWVLICISALFSGHSPKPIAGKTFTLEYAPQKAGILADAPKIWVVYAFDYWGTKAHQKQRGERGETDLFLNVLFPDSGRAQKIAMIKKGKKWLANISIPSEAALLPYYFTDGVRNDDNGCKTFVSYIYNKKGKPVRDARFRNVDFLLMAGQNTAAVLEEIREETADYPDNFMAHVVYWRFKFFETISPDTLNQLLIEANSYFAKLHRQFGDTVLNYKALSLNDINRIIQLSLSDRIHEPFVAGLLKIVNATIAETV